MRVDYAALRIITNSRGEPTLEAELGSGGFRASASVPSGKSRGAHEVAVAAPERACADFPVLQKELLGRDAASQKEFDGFLIAQDGTPDKHVRGGNTLLAFSIAWARLKAQEEKKSLVRYLREACGFHGERVRAPRPILNVINGGAHAKNPLAFQEYQIIPDVADAGMAVGLGKEFYEKLRRRLEQIFGQENICLGDEAGFSAPFRRNEEPLEIMAELIEQYRYPLRLGLDAAASQFYHPSRIAGFAWREAYEIDGARMSPFELLEYYKRLILHYALLSLEDPFHEEDFKMFGALVLVLHTAARETLLITDDLTATNIERLGRAIREKSGSAILVKPNQIGTVSETLAVVREAYAHGWQAVVSHRSGETMDDFIADLAVAVGAWGLKAGAPGAPERMAKYDRLIALMQAQGGDFI